MFESQLAGPDMLIDGYDQYNQRQDAEVVNITPDDASEEPAEDTLLADDCMYRSKHAPRTQKPFLVCPVLIALRR